MRGAAGAANYHTSQQMERWQEQAATMRHNAKVSSLAISSEESPQVQVLVGADCLACCCCILCDKGDASKGLHPGTCKSVQLPAIQHALCTAMH